MVVFNLDRPGRFESGTSGFLSGHSGAVLDMDWNPFDDNMVATASEDTNIKIWSIPEDWEPVDDHGNAKAGKEFSESLVDLEAHTKKVTLVRYHPTAGNTLLSCSADYTCKVWDVENSTAVTSFDGISNLVHDIIWDMKGDMYACSAKDKAIHIVDPRTGKEASKISKAHDGAKSIKMTYVNDTGKMFSFGASRQSQREIKVWDIKDLSKPIHSEVVDTAAGAMIPLWDHDTNVLYLCGKGDGVVRLYEYEEKKPYIIKLNDGFRSNIPGKGYCLVPKRGLDVMKHETARILKCTNNSGVHPLHFYVPRKSDAFQEDIFPDCPSSNPAHTHAEWFAGSSKEAETMSLKPGSKQAAAAVKKTTFKSVATVSKELAEAKKRIAYLEGKLKDANIEY